MSKSYSLRIHNVANYSDISFNIENLHDYKELISEKDIKLLELILFLYTKRSVKKKQGTYNNKISIMYQDGDSVLIDHVEITRLLNINNNLEETMLLLHHIM